VRPDEWLVICSVLFFLPIQVKMAKLVLAVNVGFLAAVVAVTLAALHGGARLFAVGLLCAALTIGMYAAPLGAMVSTRSRICYHTVPHHHISTSYSRTTRL